jgi:hypothetical protein
VDHIGYILFPRVLWLRIVGRLAMPIFAYMIAEGCRHTKNRRKYLLTMVFFAAVCQVVYLVVMRSLYQCIFVTFSLSICLIYLMDSAREKRNMPSVLFLLVGFLLTAALCFGGARWIRGFDIDYGFFGVLLPVLIYCGKDPSSRLILAACGMALLCDHLGGIQWYCMASLPLLALYNGERGKRKMKYLFYVYYPAHFVVIYAIARLLRL